MTYGESTSSDGFPLNIEVETEILGSLLNLKLYQEQSYLKTPSLGSSVLIKNVGDLDITEAITDNLVKYLVTF